VKLGTNIRYVSGHCWKNFKIRGQSSRSWSDGMLRWRRHAFWRCDVEAHLFVIVMLRVNINIYWILLTFSSRFGLIGWCGGAIGRSSDKFAIYRSRVQLLPRHHCAVALGELLTPECLCRQAV